ncbi:MAG: PAS domain-containing protein [Bdellovibrionia bacterium]
MSNEGFIPEQLVQLGQEGIQAELLTILNCLPQIVWTTDCIGKVTFYNDRWWDYTGLRPEHYNDAQPVEVIHPEDREAVLKKWEQGFKTGELIVHEYRLRNHSNQYRWFLGRVVPIRDSEGEIRYWLGTTADIHDLHEATEQVQSREQQLRLITDAVPALIGYIDPELCFRFVNARYESWFERPLQSMLNRPIREVLGDKHFESVKARLDKAMQGEAQNWQMLAHYEHESRWIEVTFAPDMGPDGQCRGVVSLVQNISDRKKLEESQREAEGRFRAFFNQSSLPLHIYAADGSSREANPAWEKLFEATLDQLNDYNLLKDPQAEAIGVAHVFRRALQGEAVQAPAFYYDPALSGKMGRPRWLESDFFPLRDLSGRVTEVAIVYRDVSDREKALGDLRQANRQLEEALHARQELIDICSHELKTPLTTLRLQTQTALRKISKGDVSVCEPARIQRLLASCDDQMGRLNHLVEDMLDLTRISAGKLPIDPERFSLSALVLEVLERFDEQFSEAGCRASTSLEPNVIGNWDRFRIDQVLTNLISNAIKYAKGKPIQVSLRKSQDAKVAVLSVKDEGAGIAPENHERIFNRFERAVSANEISGLGLGLYITRQIIELHAGTIHVESALGKGATFIVELPLST